MNLIIGISTDCNIAILNNAMAIIERLFKIMLDFQYYYATLAWDAIIGIKIEHQLFIDNQLSHDESKIK